MAKFVCMIAAISFSTGLMAAAGSDPLFAVDESMQITLIGPFARIDEERDKEREYPGSLRYMDEAGTEIVLDADFQVRGNWRLDPGNCSYSQLWVDLRRGQLPGTVFTNQNRLKLVVQCRNPNRYAGFLHTERQAYRIFSLLSDYHFDTRLLELTYVDSESEDEQRSHPGFFIEHQNRLADRFEMEEVEENRVSSAELNALESTIVSLFMYMISNTDFSLIQGPAGDECCHNGKLLRAASGELFYIPYDFDASGLVDASYAPGPHPDFNLRGTRDRYYRGFCVDEAVMQEAVARFQESREDIMAIVANDPGVTRNTSRRNARFFEEFFATLDNERKFRREILNQCR